MAVHDEVDARRHVNFCCALIEGHVAKSAPSMFKGAIKPVVDGLAKLRADVKTLLRTTCSKKLLDDLRRMEAESAGWFS